MDTNIYSVSKIQTYIECPYKYYLKYITKTLPERRTIFLQQGLTFSDIIEEIYTNISIYSSITIEDIQQLCDMYWIPKQYKLDFQSSKQPSWNFLGYSSAKDELKAKLEMIKYVKEYTDLYSLTSPFGVELPLTCDIEGYSFYGRIDICYFSRSKGLAIYDNKLGSTTYDVKKNLQLSLYSVAALKVYNIPTYEVGIRYVKQNTFEYQPISDIEISDAVKTFVNVVKNIEKGEYYKQPNIYCKYCKGCEHGSIISAQEVLV